MILALSNYLEDQNLDYVAVTKNGNNYWPVLRTPKRIILFSTFVTTLTDWFCLVY